MISRSIFVYSYLDKLEKKFGVEELGFQKYYKANREGISSVSYVWNNYTVLAIQLLFFLVFASLSTFGLL